MIIKYKHAPFVVFVLLSIGIFYRVLKGLVICAFDYPSCSHIVLIPFVALGLIYLEKNGIFEQANFPSLWGVLLVLPGALICWLAGTRSFAGEGNFYLSASALGLALLWMGGFLFSYGTRATVAAIFPLLFLVFMVPLPEPILSKSIHLLQQGSTQVAYLLFQAVGVPALRQGFQLSVPGITIEVARECSGIRSSMALFITSVLAARFFLRTPWKGRLLVLAVFPLAVIKNGIRITTLTLLSLYVDPSFLYGHLHRDGGFVFFLIALAMLGGILVLLQRSERAPASQGTPVQAQGGAAGRVTL